MPHNHAFQPLVAAAVERRRYNRTIAYPVKLKDRKNVFV